MKVCPSCESMLPEHYEICPKCGKELKLEHKVKMVAGGNKVKEDEVKDPLININVNEYNIHDLDDILETSQ